MMRCRLYTYKYRSHGEARKWLRVKPKRNGVRSTGQACGCHGMSSAVWDLYESRIQRKESMAHDQSSLCLQRLSGGEGLQHGVTCVSHLCKEGEA